MAFVDGELPTTKWPNMQLPETEVLVVNLQGKNKYASLPEFVEKMDKLKVLIVTNDQFSYTELSNFELLSSLTNLKRIRLESVSISSIIKNPLRLKSVQKLSLFDCEFDEVAVRNSFKLSDAFPNLEEVNFQMYLLVKVARLNQDPQKVTFLALHCWAINELPKYIGEVKSLRKLDVRGCPNLRKLPESVLDLEQLEEVICDEHSQKRWEPLLSRLRNKNNKLNIVVAYSDPLFMVET